MIVPVTLSGNIPHRYITANVPTTNPTLYNTISRQSLPSSTNLSAGELGGKPCCSRVVSRAFNQITLRINPTPAAK